MWVLWTAVLSAVLMVPYLWAMLNLPGTQENACLIGASLTWQNVLFSGLLSVMSAWMVFGLWLLHKQRAFRLRMAAGGTLGGILGFFTVFCTFCSFPVISFFGLSLGSAFFSEYHGMFKAISISLMAFVLWLLNEKLKHCEACA